MNKTSPIARGVRTFVMALAATAPTWLLLDFVNKPKESTELVVLALIAAALAGLVAFLLALSASYRAKVDTPIWRAIATTLQVLAAGVGTLGLNELTNTAAVTFAHAVVTVVIGAIVAGVVSLITNAAEDNPAPAGQAA